MMKLTKRFKELYIDIFVKILQIVFAALVISPFVSGKFNAITFITGIAASLLCIGVASRIAMAIKEKEE